MSAYSPSIKWLTAPVPPRLATVAPENPRFHPLHQTGITTAEVSETNGDHQTPTRLLRHTMPSIKHSSKESTMSSFNPVNEITRYATRFCAHHLDPSRSPTIPFSHISSELHQSTGTRPHAQHVQSPLPRLGYERPLRLVPARLACRSILSHKTYNGFEYMVLLAVYL
jgi:hypothetical protein